MTTWGVVGVLSSAKLTGRGSSGSGRSWCTTTSTCWNSSLQPADIPHYGRGLDLESAMSALRIFVRHPGFRGMMVCEFYPDHSQDDSAQRLVAGLATALG